MAVPDTENSGSGMDSETNNNLSVVVGSQFCTAEARQLIFPGNGPRLRQKSLAAFDIDGRIIFKTQNPRRFNPRHRCLLIDAASAGNPLVSIQKKLMDRRGAWQVFAGDSYADEDLLFTVERTQRFQIKASTLDVFLATNTSKERCDYRIEGGYRKKSCKVYKGDSLTIIAQMSEEPNGANLRLIKGDGFSVAINPDTDSAFIAALFVVRRGFHNESKNMILALALSGGTAAPLVVLNLALLRLF